MEIKTQDGERNVASKGLGGTALGLAIPGTVALANQLFGGALTGAANFKEVVQGFIAQNEINASKFAQLDKEVALNKQAAEYNFAILNNKIDCCCDKMRLYVDATFVPGKLVMPLSSLCPEAMQRYNSWTAPTTTEPAA